MKVLLINSMCGIGSTGRIVEGIADVLFASGHDAKIAYSLESSENPIAFKFGSDRDHFIHRIMSHAFDMQGLCSKAATKELIKFIDDYKPDIVNLHNIHGNFLNYPLLFSYLSKNKIQTVWTLHDCWSFTGHCPHFDYIGCTKWLTGCHNCNQLYVYPKSEFWDGSKRNYGLKKKYFTDFPEKLHIVAVSTWLEDLAKQSFLKASSTYTINNGIDLSQFKPIKDLKSIRDKYGIDNRKVVLAVASPWGERKGLNDLYQLWKLINKETYQLVIVGLSQDQIDSLPAGINGIPRTNGIDELARLYSLADVFVNPTYEDSFPTVNLEALACGTPIVVYRTGGSPDAVSDETGIIVDKGDIKSMLDAIVQIIESTESYTENQCRNSAILRFDKNNSYKSYVRLFEELCIHR